MPNYGQGKVRLAHLERLEQVVALYKQHLPLHEIKERMGFKSSKTVSKLLQEAVARVPVPGAEAMRDRENRTLDAMQAKLNADVEKGTPAAISLSLDIMARRAQLNDLDLTKKQASVMIGIGTQLPSPVQQAAFEAARVPLGIPDDLCDEPLAIESNVKTAQ